MSNSPVIPKVHSAADVAFVHDLVEKHAHADAKDNIKLIASVESARAIMNLKEVRASLATAHQSGL